MKVRNALGEESKMTWEHVTATINTSFSDTSLIDDMIINGSENDQQLIAEYQNQLDNQ